MKCCYPGGSAIPEKSFDELIAEALSWQFSGWDFSYLRGRLVEEPPPWNYSATVKAHFSSANVMVDMGTGGGELLSQLTPLPPFSCATEGYAPNVPVARKKLAPLGVEVIRTYCDDNYAVPQRGALPFRDSSIDLVIDRHESFKAGEVLRVLRPGGVFITQQVGNGLKSELNAFLGAKIPEMKWSLSMAKRQLMNAGFSIVEEVEAEPRAIFKDIGAVVCYLRIVEWQIDDFEVSAYEEKLRQLDSLIRKNGSFVARNRLFFVKAVKE